MKISIMEGFRWEKIVKRMTIKVEKFAWFTSNVKFTIVRFRHKKTPEYFKELP